MKKILFILFIVLSCTQAAALEKVSLQLKWKYQFQFAGYIMAKETGFYKDVGLDVDLLEYTMGLNILEDVQKGKINFATSDSSIILEALEGKPVVAMMSVLQHSPFALMALKSSNINFLKDVYGKKLSLYDDLNGMAISAMLYSHNVTYIKNPITFSLDTLLSGENDMLTVYLSNEPFVAQERGLEFTLLSPKDYGFDEYADILFTSKNVLQNRPELVDKMYQASKKGWEYAFSHIDESADVMHRKYNTLKKSKKAFVYEAETLKSLSGYGENFGELKQERVENIAQIFSFMKKGKKNFENLKEFIYKPKVQMPQNKTSLFTQEELEYIKTKKTIKVCATKEHFPFVQFNKKEISGLSIEFLKQITNQSHLNFDIIEAKNLENHFKMIEEGICDISPIILTKPNMFHFLTPTQPIGSDSIVLVTKLSEPYIDNLNNLKNKKIAILKGSKNLIQYVKSIHPNMQLVEVENFTLHSIANGEFYGVVGPSYEMAHKIATEYFNELKIMSKIGDTKIDGSFGITIREPILLRVFNKSIENVSPLERQKIVNSWLRVNVEKQVDYTRLIQVASAALFIIAILTFFYLRQKKLTKVIKVLHDTLETRVEEEVEKNKQQQLLMLQQNRLAQMGEMISMIAHQWRQPLNTLAILNQTLVLKYRRGKLDDTLIETFKENSKKQISQMSNTIDDFRDFFKPEKEKIEFCINDVMHHVLEILKPVLEINSITILFEEEGRLSIIGYPNELGQAILNLISNAKDALLENDVQDKQISIALKKTDTAIELLVGDNAGGIPEEIMDKIFDPYFSTKVEKNGTGLGLYMTKMIIEEHMGAVLSISNDDRGAVFKICF